MPATQAKPKPPGTKPTQIRLTDEDKAEIEVVRSHLRLPSMAAAIRHCVRAEVLRMRRGGSKPKPAPPASAAS